MSVKTAKTRARRGLPADRHHGLRVVAPLDCNSARTPRILSNMTDSQVIDPQALERLREWGGDKLAAQMVRLFLKNSGTRMDQIRTGVAQEDPDEAERGAHSLKSSAANIGAESLRTLATRVESASLEENVEALKLLLPELESAYAAAMAELESLEREMPDES